MAINVVHRLVYFVPEAAEEYAAFGIKGQGGYFASRSAPMGAVTDSVVLATFYNFSPLAVTSALPLFTPGKNRKIPCRAVGVRTTASTLSF